MHELSKLMSTKIFVCPQCGTKLVGADEKPKPNDVMKCPLHGVVGTIEELVRAGWKLTGADTK